MKKISYLIVLIFIMSTVGVVIEKHYSMGDLYDISLYGEADRCCEEGCGCCSEDTHLYRILDGYTLSYSPQINNINNEEPIAPIEIIVNSSIEFIKNITVFKSHSPPGPGPELAILQSFRC